MHFVLLRHNRIQFVIGAVAFPEVKNWSHLVKIIDGSFDKKLRD